MLLAAVCTSRMLQRNKHSSFDQHLCGMMMPLRPCRTWPPSSHTAADKLLAPPPPQAVFAPSITTGKVVMRYEDAISAVGSNMNTQFNSSLYAFKAAVDASATKTLTQQNWIDYSSSIKAAMKQIQTQAAQQGGWRLLPGSLHCSTPAPRPAFSTQPLPWSVVPAAPCSSLHHVLPGTSSAVDDPHYLAGRCVWSC
jgi:hypothetical protein